MNPIVKILIERDGMSIVDAEDLLKEARIEFELDPYRGEEILEEYFGLEPDYIFDLMVGLA